MRLGHLVQQHGLNRRRLLRALSAGGVAAVLAACGDTSDSQAAAASAPTSQPVTDDAAPPQPPAWFKDTTPFIQHDDGKSLEARLENMDALITPSRDFFVRNNSVSLNVDVESWRLSVEGDAVTNPLTLTYDDIRKPPSRALVCYLECAGNHRAMFDLVKGRQARGTQWKTGGVGNGEWVGVPLRDMLASAGISDAAVGVLLIGLDTESPEEGLSPRSPGSKGAAPGHAPCLQAERRGPSTRPRISPAGARAWLGRKQQRQVAGPYRRHEGTSLDAQHHHVLRARRRRLSA